MTLQSRHYNAFAAALRRAGIARELARTIARELVGTNPAFDPDRFVEATQ